MIGIAIGFPILCVGLAIAFLRHSFEVNPVDKNVTEINDFLIWKIRKSHLFTEVKSVALSVTEQLETDTKRYFVNIHIAASNYLVTVVSEPARHEQEVRKIATQLAEILGVTLEDKISDDL